ncbi:Uncharacterized protein Adt_46760 [Abeliophyllum distichum]|uniref:Uncharacterized protein n=1 Tax=Abeliophyllum distichum TaxID=126358 RepID=A0ABD1NY35_9LAMI
MSWSDENEHAFIGILYDNVKSGKLQCSIFTKDEWGKINADLIVVIKSDYRGREIEGTTATGGLGYASTTLPPTAEEERQLEDDFLSRGVHVHVENDDDDEVTNTRRRDDRTSNERRRKEPKISKSGKLEECMAQWSSTMSMRTMKLNLGRFT